MVTSRGGTGRTRSRRSTQSSPRPRSSQSPTESRLHGLPSAEPGEPSGPSLRSTRKDGPLPRHASCLGSRHDRSTKGPARHHAHALAALPGPDVPATAFRHHQPDVHVHPGRCRPALRRPGSLLLRDVQSRPPRSHGRARELPCLHEGLVRSRCPVLQFASREVGALLGAGLLQRGGPLHAFRHHRQAGVHPGQPRRGAPGPVRRGLARRLDGSFRHRRCAAPGGAPKALLSPEGSATRGGGPQVRSPTGL